MRSVINPTTSKKGRKSPELLFLLFCFSLWRLLPFIIFWIKIKEAQDSTMKAAEHLTRDMVWIMQRMMRSGADGVNFDTTAAAGDGDFYATLKAVKTLRSATLCLWTIAYWYLVPTTVLVWLAVVGLRWFRVFQREGPVECWVSLV